MTAAPLPPTADLDAFRQDRVYLGADHARNERRTWLVTAICSVTLVAQLAGGVAFKSMALTASGLHMAAHVAALLVAAGAYAFARRHAGDSRFSFGTGKVGYLAGFANAVVLAITAVGIAMESLERIISPESVHYHGALPLALAGLAVNVVCVWLLAPTRASHHRHDRDGDLNISAAHLHLSADAIVSVMAICAMLVGLYMHWDWADALAGLAGAVLVAHFAWTLMRKAASALLDMNPSAELTARILERLQSGGETVEDLHLWRLGPGHHAAVAVVCAEHPPTPDVLRARLEGLAGLSHVTLEVRGGPGGHHGHSHS